MAIGMLRRHRDHRGAAPSAPPRASLEEKGVEELRAVAKERGISGYTSMKKSELIEALEEK